MIPISIKVVDQKNLLITWDDKSISRIDLSKLRRFCPCATCIADRENQSKTYISLFASDQVKVEKIFEVGNYAIGIKWKDGHNTGIYEFPYLKNLALECNSI